MTIFAGILAMFAVGWNIARGNYLTAGLFAVLLVSLIALART